MNTAQLVSNNLFQKYFKWLLIVMIVAAVIQIGALILSSILNFPTSDYLSVDYDANSIFLLVIGIISVYPYFTRYAYQGVNRKNYFNGVIQVATKIVTISLVIALAFV